VAFPGVEDALAWGDVIALRDRLDPLAGRIPPHLTLVFPFDDPISDEALASHVRDVVGDLEGFPVVLREITAHEGEYLFLNVKQGNDAVIRLHDALYSGPLAAHRVRLHTFVPHVTVGRVSPAQLPAALAATAALTAAIRARVDVISAYRIERDGTREVIVEVPLAAPRGRGAGG
jgi:2'-5' RNA ligase